MIISTYIKRISQVTCSTLAIALILLFTGCEDDGNGSVSGDTGDNDKNIAVALGDSITAGQGVAPYPGILAGMSGKQVINAGSGGARADSGPGRASSLLNSHKAAYLFILLGSNDAIHGGDPAAVKGALAATIGVAIDHQAIPIIGTLPQMVRGHESFNGGVKAINQEIRALAGETGTTLVDLEGVIGADLLQEDGLHPTQAGQEAIARSIAGVF